MSWTKNICLDDIYGKILEKAMEQQIPHIQTVGHQNKRVTHFVLLYDTINKRPQKKTGRVWSKTPEFYTIFVFLPHNNILYIYNVVQNAG